MGRTMTQTREERFLRMMMRLIERLLRKNGSRKETVKYIRLETLYSIRRGTLWIFTPPDTGSLCGGSGLRS